MTFKLYWIYNYVYHVYMFRFEWVILVHIVAIKFIFFSILFFKYFDLWRLRLALKARVWVLLLLPHSRDRASHNDVIGTTHLCMSKISAPGGEIDGE